MEEIKLSLNGQAFIVEKLHSTCEPSPDVKKRIDKYARLHQSKTIGLKKKPQTEKRDS